jgi:hypothetical protein
MKKKLKVLIIGTDTEQQVSASFICSKFQRYYLDK